MHVVWTVIVSSLTVISLAALEYTHLNSAAAYEKEAVAKFYNAKTNELTLKEEKIALENFREDTYSSEIDLNSWVEVSKEAEAKKMRMQKSFERILGEKSDHPVIQKLTSLDDESKANVLRKINDKITELQTQKNTNKRKSDMRLWNLLAARWLFLTK